MANSEALSSPNVPSLQPSTWKKLNVTGIKPSLRQGHAAVVVKEKVYLFGGSALNDESESIFYKDLYSMSLKASEHVWQKLDSSGDTPPPREGHSLLAINEDIYLCGGVDSDESGTCVKEIYIYETGSNNWIMKEPSGDIPQATSSSMVLAEDLRIMVFGGVCNGVASSNTFILDTDTLVWSQAVTRGTSPKPRCDHGCCISDKKMFVFGGSAGESLWLNDLHYLDLDTLEWVTIGVIDHAPSPRDYSTLSKLSNKFFPQMVLFGGFSGSDENNTCTNNLHILSIKNKTDISWQPLSKEPSQDGPHPQGRYGHVCFTLDNQVFIQGGQDENNMFDDLWMIEFELPKIIISPTVPPRRNYKTDVPVPAPRRNLNPPTPKEADPRDFDTLRTQYISKINEMFDNLTKQFSNLDSQRKMLEAEREQLEEEKKELHQTYDKQQNEITEMLDNHKRDNEAWVEKMRIENDEQRRVIAEEKARLKNEHEELEEEKKLFQEKSIKLDNIMKQVKGLTT